MKFCRRQMRLLPRGCPARRAMEWRMFFSARTSPAGSFRSRGRKARIRGAVQSWLRPDVLITEVGEQTACAAAHRTVSFIAERRHRIDARGAACR